MNTKNMLKDTDVMEKILTIKQNKALNLTEREKSIIEAWMESTISLSIVHMTELHAALKQIPIKHTDAPEKNLDEMDALSRDLYEWQKELLAKTKNLPK